MSHECPVDECKDVKNLRLALKWWAGIIIVVIIAVSAPALYAWASTLIIPEIKVDVKTHEQRITIIEAQQEQILKNTEEIKQWVRFYYTGDKK